MYVCEHCLCAIESHEGNQFSRQVSYPYPDDMKWANECEEIAICDWCEDEFDADQLYEI